MRLRLVVLLSLARPVSTIPAQVPSSLDAAQAKALQLRAKANPDSVRDAIWHSFAASTSAGSQAESARHLNNARQLASAYKEAWDDPFFVQRVRIFSLAPGARKKLWIRADSLRRAGINAIDAEGVPAAMRLWRTGLNTANALGDDAAISPALLSVAGGFYRLGKLDSASSYLVRAEELARRAGDNRTLGNTIGVLATIAKDGGNSRRAETLYRRASLIRARSGDTRGMAADQNNLGTLAEERGDLNAATAAYRQALSINRRDHRPILVALNLSNLAGIARAKGNFAESEALYREAFALHSKNGADAEGAYDLHELGRTLIDAGDYQDAERALTDALRLFDASGAAAEAVDVRADLAAVASAVGDPERARALLLEASKMVGRNAEAGSSAAGIAMARGNLAVLFGTFADAENEYAKATAISRGAGDSAGMAQALEARGLLMHLRGDDTQSLSLLRESERLQLSRGQQRAAAITSLTIAEVETSSGALPSANRTIARARGSFHSLGDPVGEAACLAILGDIALQRKSRRQAEIAYRAGLKVLGARPASDVSRRLHLGLGEALSDNASLNESAMEFRTAIESTERIAATLRLAERRSGFLSDKWDAYGKLALIELRRGHTGDAFSVSERMHARQMLDLISQGRISGTAASMREQELRRRIGFLTQTVETRAVTEPIAREISLRNRDADSRRQELDLAQKAYSKFLDSLRDSNPRYARFVAGNTRSWREVAAKLRRDEVLLEYLLNDSTSTVFVVTSDTIAAIDLHIGRVALADLIEFSRKTVEKQAPGRATELWEAPLRRLYLTLVQPVSAAGYLRGKRTVLIAPHGELHFVSFAALIDPDGHFMVDRYELAYTPSATVWADPVARSVRVPSKRVLVLAPNSSRLPGTMLEASAIRRIYGSNAVIRTGADATPQALRAGLSQAGTVHLATFGVLNKHNPLFSFIELAPTKQDDGRLEVNEVFGLPLSGQLVILSACQTALASGALADVPPGDDWVGLVQAFLQSGASGVLASLWPVDDRATSALMQQFHQRLAGGATPAAALAAAQRTVRRNPATRQPTYWAAFTLTGEAD